jgi:hypothetical protein
LQPSISSRLYIINILGHIFSENLKLDRFNLKKKESLKIKQVKAKQESSAIKLFRLTESSGEGKIIKELALKRLLIRKKSLTSDLPSKTVNTKNFNYNNHNYNFKFNESSSNEYKHKNNILTQKLVVSFDRHFPLFEKYKEKVSSKYIKIFIKLVKMSWSPDNSYVIKKKLLKFMMKYIIKSCPTYTLRVNAKTISLKFDYPKKIYLHNKVMNFSKRRVEKILQLFSEKESYKSLKILLKSRVSLNSMMVLFYSASLTDMIKVCKKGFEQKGGSDRNVQINVFNGSIDIRQYYKLQCSCHRTDNHGNHQNNSNHNRIKRLKQNIFRLEKESSGYLMSAGLFLSELTRRLKKIHTSYFTANNYSNSLQVNNRVNCEKYKFLKLARNPGELIVVIPTLVNATNFIKCSESLEDFAEYTCFHCIKKIAKAGYDGLQFNSIFNESVDSHDPIETGNTYVEETVYFIFLTAKCLPLYVCRYELIK